MIGIVAAAWGLFGGAAIAGIELMSSIHRRGTWPWRPRKGEEDPEVSLAAYITGEVIRVLIGAGLAWRWRPRSRSPARSALLPWERRHRSSLTRLPGGAW
jgi:hypothetical protein